MIRKCLIITAVLFSMTMTWSMTAFADVNNNSENEIIAPLNTGTGDSNLVQETQEASAAEVAKKEKNETKIETQAGEIQVEKIGEKSAEEKAAEQKKEGSSQKTVKLLEVKVVGNETIVEEFVPDPEEEEEVRKRTDNYSTSLSEAKTSSFGESAKRASYSAEREAMVAFAKKFLGNPYVYGGTSLTNGTDCSGFTMQIYANFGHSIGRSSRQQAGNGRQISESEIQPGDLIFYAKGSYINHVAMYIGNGQVIHASNRKVGIVISPVTYRNPVKIVNFLD